MFVKKVTVVYNKKTADTVNHLTSILNELGIEYRVEKAPENYPIFASSASADFGLMKATSQLVTWVTSAQWREVISHYKAMG